MVFLLNIEFEFEFGLLTSMINGNHGDQQYVMICNKLKDFNLRILSWFSFELSCF